MTSGSFVAGGDEPVRESSQPSGLLDMLGVAAVLLDARGRIVLWSPQAEELFGYTAEEALGQYAARVLVHEEHLDVVTQLFADVMATGSGWAGAFPVRLKDGSLRVVEFRNMRLLNDRGDFYALGLAADRAAVRQVERDVALSMQMVTQSPIGLAVLDTDLRFVSVNPALAQINGVPAEDHIGRTFREVLPFVDVDAVESAIRRVLRTGRPLIELSAVGRTPADPGEEHAWSVSFYRLDDATGAALGVAISVLDVTERHRSAVEIETARRRLALIADASARMSTTLDLDRTAHELADIAVPELADIAAVDLLDTVLEGHRSGLSSGEAAVIRAVAVKAGHPTEALNAADPEGQLAWYAADRLVTECVRTGRPVLVRQVTDQDLRRIARDEEAATHLARAGVHSYLAVPLIARGEVLGALDLKRSGNPRPFSEDDLVLARELAARASVAIDNARWYQNARNTAVTLQRSLLPERAPAATGLDVASRYQPAGAASEVGGDWFDVIPLEADKSALVVGDVMGSGIDAAATMGRLRTATSTLASLNLAPATLLEHLDKITEGLDHYIATCVYAVYDPHRQQCEIARAGHLPPVLLRPGHRPELLELPTGVPLGVGGVPFSTTTVDFRPGDQLVLYTDGLVETRQHSLDERLTTLLWLLDEPGRSLDDTCDHLLRALRHPDNHDDVALLIARARRWKPPGAPSSGE
ncbi:SpoIIE family protein phosphatase [Streptomyces himalayensis]|uniref:protein-serine/threonine phosphatase n=1 Tax=Streptomyces himalayensis subsp. himalayensis TaxID=2756131 RepID=A0A7W0DSR3_9ACTN|nr:SpoIIE family protein phosphatase [Streptomyces himalayensis]MBA2950575.1 SpoIIE family protein phosphatase [Streptomyces himalayensis subsp. himalayensis]